MKFIIFCGASGSGKSKLQHDIKDIVPFATNYTTRPLRDDEIDGEHIKYVTVGEFINLIQNNELLEYSYYGNYLYGTPKWVQDDSLCYQMTKAKSGIENLLQHVERKDIYIIHVYADTVTRVLRMLRQKRSHDEIEHRLSLDTKELLDFYDSIADVRIVNNSDDFHDYVTLVEMVRSLVQNVIVKGR